MYLEITLPRRALPPWSCQKLMKVFGASSIKESSIILELYFIRALQ
ncbi:hypothetical protein CsSME_00038067 [Camellia sinensis var. sinensis]